MKRIVLCRPTGPRNVGAVLRAALNFGPAEIVIKQPGRPSLLIHPDFDLMSHGGEDARARIRVVETIEEALDGCHHAVAFTARARKNDKRVDWRQRTDELAVIGDDPDQTLALIFGSEESGLTREEVRAAQELAHLRTAREHTSLNLAQAVTVVLHSLFTGTRVHQQESAAKKLDNRGRVFLKQRMIEVFAGQVAQTESAAEDITSAIERIFSRAELEPRDARAWHLMLHALGSDSTPGGYGLGGQEKGARRRDAIAKHGERLRGDPSPTGEAPAGE